MKPYYTYGVIDAKGRISKPLDIGLKVPCMAHDYGLSKRHAVFIDTPLQFKI